MKMNKKNEDKRNEMYKRKGKYFLKHCYKHPKDVLRLGKATILYGTKGVKARAGELARREWKEQEERRSNNKEYAFSHLKFSIIMPVYNVQICWLDKAISSVKNQSYKNWELYD